MTPEQFETLASAAADYRPANGRSDEFTTVSWDWLAEVEEALRAAARLARAMPKHSGTCPTCGTEGSGEQP